MGELTPVTNQLSSGMILQVYYCQPRINKPWFINVWGYSSNSDNELYLNGTSLIKKPYLGFINPGFTIFGFLLLLGDYELTQIFPPEAYQPRLLVLQEKTGDIFPMSFMGRCPTHVPYHCKRINMDKHPPTLPSYLRCDLPILVLSPQNSC